MPTNPPHVAVIGAGIGGLATALRLAHRKIKVSVFERHRDPGGKMRQLPTCAGPVDAGPTVLTMKPVFDALFAEVGLRLEDVVTFQKQELLARHFWRDGTTLDLMHDPDATHENIASSFGEKSAQEFTQFSAHARQLFEAFEAPIMRSSRPSLANLIRIVALHPRLLREMEPMRTFEASLNRRFSDLRLAQLFARYATYVGGLPDASPALLGLIWHAESRGVWHVKGGMHQLAKSIEKSAEKLGASFYYGAHVTRIETENGKASFVQTGGTRIPIDAIVFNGDPRALQTGMLGDDCKPAVKNDALTPRSLSAHVMSFAAEPCGVSLAAHNVFFAQNSKNEYLPLGRALNQTDPTLYVCAQDRFGGAVPKGPERFEVILNSPPIDPAKETNPHHAEKVSKQCQTHILKTLRQHGLTFKQMPQQTTTGPQDFDHMFPASTGSLYGRSPHGMMAAFKRPTARTQVRGLYLTGGGAHPGAGVPMAVLSAQHAAEAILSDLHLT